MSSSLNIAKKGTVPIFKRRKRGQSPFSRAFAMCALVILCAGSSSDASPASSPQPTTTSAPATAPAGSVTITIPSVDGSGESVRGAIQWTVLITVISVAPAVLVMATCFTRIIVVLGLLRAALATQQLPPNQVLFGLAMLMTVVVMAPTGGRVYQDAAGPYLDGKLSGPQALVAAERHAREFMIGQVEAAGNSADVLLFQPSDRPVKTWRDVPTWSLLPGYAVSELKVAFLMGFRVFLPFLVIDMLVASVLVSMGMLMVPPSLISLPFKLLLFVLADGWHLVIGTLMGSFR